MKKYNKKNCSSKIREVATDQYGRTITLLGTHAFEWKIAIESCGKITIEVYPNRIIAKEKYKKLLKRK